MAYNKNFNNSAPKQKATDKYKNYEFGIKVTVVPRTFGGAKKPFMKKGAAPAPQPAQQSASTEPESKGYLINFYNLQSGDANNIVNKINSIQNKYTYKLWVNPGDDSNLSVEVKVDDFDNWMQSDMNALQSVLLQSPNNYDKNMIMHLSDQVDSSCRSNNTADNAEIMANTEKSIADMWASYLSKINDPTVMEQIKLYSRAYENLNKIFGHVLSMANVDLIRNRDKDATFVLTKNQWESMFNRGVKAGAKKFPYWCPNSSGFSQKGFNDVKNNSIWKDETSLSPQVRRAMELIASDGNDGDFRIVVGYDVKDTYLLDGAKEDTFNTTIGYLNNLTGELNAKAEQYKSDMDAKAAASQTPKTSAQTLMEKRTKMACDYMNSTAQEKNIHPLQTGNDSNDLRDMVYEYCKILATTKAKHLNPNTTDIYAQNATKVSLIITQLALGSLNKYNTTYNYSPVEAADLMTVCFRVVKELENATVVSMNEGVMSFINDKAQFVKKFVQVLKMIGCRILRKGNDEPQDNSQIDNATSETPEEIKESFYRVFNKINKQIF